MPLTEKQIEYLRNCNHRWNVKTGATGSGKSFLDFTVTIPKRINACRGEGLIVLMGNTRGTLERNILEPMRQWWPGNVGIIRGDNTVDLFGKKAYALGADNKKHVARIQGATFEYAYGDEVTTWSEDVFQMLKSRLRCEHSHFDGTCNPDNPNHWFKAFLDSDADIYQQSYTIDDGVLPANVVKSLKSEYSGTVFYRRYILGEWARAEGAIYPAFADNPHRYETTREELPGFRYITVGVDFGGNKSAYAFVATGITHDWTPMALRSLRIPAKGVSVEQMITRFTMFCESVESDYRPIDYVYADCAEQAIINSMDAQTKWRILGSVKGEIIDRIRAMDQLLSSDRFKYVSGQCDSLVKALCDAVWDDKKLEDVRLDDGTSDIDTLDAWEYSFSAFLRQIVRR